MKNQTPRDPGELRRQAEAQARATEPAAPAAQTPEEIEQMLEELRVYQIELEMQNENLRRTQLQLEKERDKYFHQFDLAPVGYLTLNDKGIVGSANLTAAHLLGVERHRVVGQPFSAFFFPADRDASYLHQRALGKTGRPQSCELRLQRAGGDAEEAPGHFWALIESRPSPTAGTEAPDFWVTFADITDRKQAEEQTLKSQLLLKASLESQKGTLLFSIDREYRYLYFNTAHADAMRRAYGQEVELGMCVLDCITSDSDRAAAKANYDRALRGESHSNIRAYGDPEAVYFESFFNPIVDDAGEVFGTTGLARDITERMQVEQALLESRDALIGLTNQVPGVVYEYRLYPDGSSAFPFSSRGMNDIYECSPEEVQADATPVFGRLHPDDYDYVADSIQESARTLKPFHVEFRVVLPRQGLRWRVSDALPQRMADGGTSWYGIIQDDTERKQAEEVLRESEAQLKNAQHFAHIGNWTWNIETNHLHWSDEMYRIFGIEQEGFSGSLPEVIATAIHPDDRAEVERSNLSVINEGKPVPIEYRIIWPDQSVHVVWAEAGELLLDDYGKPSLLRGTVQDITDRKTAEERLSRYHGRIRALNAKLVASEQRERNRLGVELHDGVGHLLFAAKMSAQLLAAEPLETSAQKQAEKLVVLLEESISEVRHLTSELAPTVLFELGLRSCLLWLRDRYSQLYGLRCTVRVARHAAQSRGDAAMFVFRVAREALNNVVRHSHVDRAILTVRESDGWMTVIIRDSGAGFDTALVNEPGDSGSFGLFSIREECLRRGATMEIESQPGKGTRIKVRVLDEAAM